MRLTALQLERPEVATIFLGGGTPSLLSGQDMFNLMEGLHDQFDIAEDAEITMEANPGEISPDKLRAFQESGVNRLSLGIQSLQERHLRFMSRIHNPAEALESIEMARKAGIDNLNLDLIFAVPGQTRKEWKTDLQRIMELEPEHLSTYSLTVEDGTALQRWVVAGHVQEMEEAGDLDLYYLTLDLVAQHGYHTYEISNHARHGYTCQHNLRYWQGGEYLGFGPSAHSYQGNFRWWNLRNLDGYFQALEEGQAPIDGSEQITPELARRDFILTRLRLISGIDLDEYRDEFGGEFIGEEQGRLEHWMPQYLEMTGEYLRLTREGLALADEIIADLL